MSQAEDLKPHGKMGDAHKDYSELTRADEPDTREQDESKAEAMAYEAKMERDDAAEKRQMAEIYKKYADQIDALKIRPFEQSREEHDEQKRQLTEKIKEDIFDVVKLHRPIDKEDYVSRFGGRELTDDDLIPDNFFASGYADYEAGRMIKGEVYPPSEFSAGEVSTLESEARANDDEAQRREYWAGVLHDHPADVEPRELVDMEDGSRVFERRAAEAQRLAESLDSDFNENGYDFQESPMLERLIGSRAVNEYLQRKGELKRDRSATVDQFLNLRKEAYIEAAKRKQAAADRIKDQLRQVEEGTYKPE